MNAGADVAADGGAAQAADSGLYAVFAAERAALARFLRARCADPADADDLLQDLWVRIGTATPGPVGNARAYLFRMANNLVLDARRARQRGMARDRGWLGADGHEVVTPELRADPAPDAEARLAREQELRLLHAAIDGLPAGAGRALRLHRIDGLPQAEVAQIMGISRSGVEKHLAVALRHLRVSLHLLVNADCGSDATAASAITGHRGPNAPGKDQS
ncbi:RNA polymerase sigma factor [Novosphingobium sp.]|uniref:RNA polymerase sigma factor n=1 Tax=Novosphingobium sp. TaxID=1874826 RepID=UPI0033423613